MKNLTLILGTILFISIGYFAYLNYGQQVNFAYFYKKTPLNVNFGLAIAALAIYSSFGAFLISAGKIMELKERVKKHMRNAERASVESDESGDKVKTLQAKIDTLEIALKESLSKK
ncbi:MAG: hypothetical protein PHC34_12635 [Candidatus Gastranaerophilales bacterium]|nr:hypothetical protein [Candidatus Gastranaerophilales bacterium]